MKDLYVGVSTESGTYELFRMNETSKTLSVICATGGVMGRAVATDNLQGTQKITHDSSPKIITERRFSLHQNGTNPAINSLNFHLSYENDNGAGKVSHVNNTPVVATYGDFVPIFCERYGSITPNLKKIPAGETLVSLGPVDFEQSTLLYAFFIGPTGRRFNHASDSWNYEHIPRALFDVHILWRPSVGKKIDGHGFLGFQPAANWKKDEVYQEMKDALNRPLNDTAIVYTVMHGLQALCRQR